MRKQFLLLALLLCAAMSASARVNVSIGIHVPIYPRLVQVPSYPVYYAPDLDSNYFFYDGQYWVYQDDGWYASEWYDGPWEYVEPEYVPYFILRVPVRYYRLPPRYFLGWRADAPPLWHVHWGTHWANQHRGWDHWDRRYVPAPAPLPVYQRNYSGPRYPRHHEQQHIVRDRHYDYRRRDVVARDYSQYQRRDRDERRFDGRQEGNRQRSFDGRPFERQRSDNAPRQFSSSPERQLMPPRVEQRERREVEWRNRQPQQQPRQEWNRQQQHAERRQMPPPEQREQRQFSQPRSDERSDRGRGQDQERNHERRDHDRGGRGERGDRGRDRE